MLCMYDATQFLISIDLRTFPQFSFYIEKKNIDFFILGEKENEKKIAIADRMGIGENVPSYWLRQIEDFFMIVIHLLPIS